MTDAPAIKLRCPDCGYTPADDVSEVHPQTDVPMTFAEALDFFEVLGADDGCVFCPKCAFEFGVPLSSGDQPAVQRELFG